MPAQTGNSGKFLTTDGTNPQWVQGGIGVYDANNVRLGSLITYNSANTTIITSTGHVLTLFWEPVNGSPFPNTSVFYWSGPNCTGTLVVNTVNTTLIKRNAKVLVVRANVPQLYAYSNPDANGLSTPYNNYNYGSSENSNGVCNNSSGNTSTAYVFDIEPISNTAAGLPTTIAYPLSVR